MALIDDLKQDRLAARKSKDAAKTSILTTLLGELETDAKKTSKEMTDDIIIAKCKKFIKNNEEAGKEATTDRFSILQKENYYLNHYIPMQMDESTIRKLCTTLGAENVGQFMKVMNSLYKGKFDGRMASTVAKEHFK